MVVFSNCKVNIGLYITGKRDDGYHNLETVFFPVPLFDVLELADSDVTAITVLGQAIPGKMDDNIVYKAWHLLKKDFPNLPPVHFYLLKNIPAGAGLGAGSANGAYTLKALNDKFQLGLTTKQLLGYALQLGSDCPFFIINQPCFAGGRGEVLEEVDVLVSNYKIVVVNPGIHISTPWAFDQISPQMPGIRLKEVISTPVEKWKDLVTNDFEAPVMHAYPSIKAIKLSLYDAGATFVSMSGSGSTVYGMFEKNTDPELHFPGNYFVRIVNL